MSISKREGKESTPSQPPISDTPPQPSTSQSTNQLSEPDDGQFSITDSVIDEAAIVVDKEKDTISRNIRALSSPLIMAVTAATPDVSLHQSVITNLNSAANELNDSTAATGNNSMNTTMTMTNTSASKTTESIGRPSTGGANGVTTSSGTGIVLSSNSSSGDTQQQTLMPALPVPAPVTVHNGLVIKKLDTSKILPPSRGQISVSSYSSLDKSITSRQNATDDIPFDTEILDPLVRFENEMIIPTWALLIIPFVGIAICWITLLLCLCIDLGTQSWYMGKDKPDFYHYTPHALFWTLFNSGIGESSALFQGIVPSSAFIFVVMVTIAIALLQTAIEKTSTVVFQQFLTARFVWIYVGFCIIGNVFSFWVALETGTEIIPEGVDADYIPHTHFPRLGPFMVCLFGNLQLLWIFPFMFKSQSLFEPNQVVQDIITHGLNTVIESINLESCLLLQELQKKTTKSIDFLMEGTNGSSEDDANNIFCATVIDALCSFAMHYAEIKSKASDQWFEIPSWLRKSPDFYLLNADSIGDLVKRKIWLEWKILRQYQHLYGQGLFNMHGDLCYHICINTRIVGLAMASQEQYAGLDLCIKFFNTFLRAGINSGDIKVVYNTLFQYRQLAELLISSRTEPNVTKAARSIQIAKFILYYANECRKKSIFFLVETVAQDFRFLCQTALLSYLNPAIKEGESLKVREKRTNKFREIHDKLLEVFLKLSELKLADKIDDNDNFARGVYRALVTLAAFYLFHNQIPHARQISARLRSIYLELTMGSTKEFWEVSERGDNFAYMPPKYAEYLDGFFGWFGWFAKRDEQAQADFWNTKEGKNLRVNTDLTNFDEQDFSIHRRAPLPEEELG